MNAHNGSNSKRLMIAAGAAAVLLAVFATTTVPAVARVMPSGLTAWARSAMAALPASVNAEFVGDMSMAPPPPYTPPPDYPTSVKFTVLNTCAGNFGGATLQFRVNGNLVGSVNGNGGDCTCGPPLRTFTTSDPAVLAVVGQPLCSTFGMTVSGSTYVSWVRAEVSRTVTGNASYCIFDHAGGACNVNDLCSANYAQYTNQTFTSTLPNQDGDGVADCTDPDLDGDSILNAADNCPVNPNATQLDADGNGRGDACDAPDKDADGILNIVDNCPGVSNAGQQDANGNGTGDVCEVDRVVAVPWLGTEALPHQVVSGGFLTLQAVATKSGTDLPVSLRSAQWSPGDGSGPYDISVNNSLALEMVHKYTGAVGQPFTATITIVDGGNHTYSDTFKVVIGANDRETKVNMAIDHGLWNLHKRMQRTTSDGKDSGFWTGYAHYHAATSAGVAQAFQINNHRQTGDATKDPYVSDVKRGLRYILSNEHGRLRSVPTSLQNGTDQPDSNGNGYGLGAYLGDHEPYIGGQYIDAIVSSGTPTAIADVGQATSVNGRQYKDIVRDILDGYSNGMNDAQGGWHYNYNSGGNDSSASHWWGIGVLAAQVWNVDAPQWVKDRQWTVGVPLMQAYPGDCHFGYTNNTGIAWDDGTNVTAAGLILINADGKAKTEPRFSCAEGYLNARYNSSMGNFYTMYQVAKAMRTAKNLLGQTSEIGMLAGVTDWYAGYADFLIANQADGAFTATNGTTAAYIVGDMATSWGVIILSPSLFQLPPAAACVADPNSLGTTGGLVNFSAAGSVHPDSTATITGYSWDFGDGSPAGSGVTTSHSYANPGVFPTIRQAKVTVTDSNGLMDTAFCPVEITDTNPPPNANTSGPYSFCPGTSLTLNGSSSTDVGPGGSPGSIVSYSWIFPGNSNFNTPNATTAIVDATAFFSALAPETYNIGLQVTDEFGATNAEFSTVTVLAANDPACNQPPTISQGNLTAEATSAAGAAVSYTPTVSDPNPADILTVSCTPPSGSTFAVGPTSVSCTVSDGKGGSASTTFTVTVTKAPTVTVISCSDVVYNGSPQETCTASVSDTHGFSQAVTVNYAGDTTNVGIVSASATFLEDSWHTSSTASTTYKIKPAEVTATAGSGGNVYDGATHSASACVVSGAYTGDLTCANDLASIGPNVGTTTTSPVTSGASIGNFIVTPVNGSYTITAAEVTATAGSGGNVYDGATHSASACVVSGAYTGDLTCANAPASIGPNVGTTTTSPVTSGASIGNFIVTPVNGSYEITPAPVTVTAGSGSNVYDGAAHAASACVVTGTGYTGDLTCSNSPADAGPNVGTTTISPVVAGSGLGNYDITTVDGSYVISKAPSTTVVTCTPSAVVYTGAPIEVCTANVTGAGDLNQAVTPVTYTNNLNVGTAGASATYGGDDNHTESSGTSSFQITQAPTSTAVNAPTITYMDNGLVTVTVTSGSGTVLGNVSLSVDGGPATTQLLSGGATTFMLSSPNAGNHGLVATYAAQGNFQASSATGNLLVNPSPTATTLTSSPSPQAAGQTVTLTANVVATGLGSGVPTGSVTFYDGATPIGTATVNGSGVAVLPTTTLSNGPHTIAATFNGDNGNYLTSNANTVSQLIYGYPVGGGTFVIGDKNAALQTNVTFWGAQWEKKNSMSGGASNNSFKGFAISPAPPIVGATFTSAPGNSAPPPASVPQYLGIIVTSKVTKSGSNITGTIVQLVVVKVNPGYAGNPGNAGTGTIVAILP